MTTSCRETGEEEEIKEEGGVSVVNIALRASNLTGGQIRWLGYPLLC